MAIVNKKVYCSAGISNVVLCSNGDVYPCLSDFRCRPPLFNVRDGWMPLTKPLLCTHDECICDCDIMWTTKWVFENNSARPDTIKAYAEKYVAEGVLFANQTMENPLKNIIHILWYPTFKCNYKCNYCSLAKDRDEVLKEYASSSPELSKDEWFAVWEEIYNRYDYGSIVIAGGEPLLSKATVPITAMISDKFPLEIISNLSTDTNVMNIVRSGIKPGTKTGLRCFTASLHPTAKGFNKDFFLGALLYLKEHGFFVNVNFVTYPLQLYLAPEYKKWCDEHGIHFMLSDWRGGGGPDGFTVKYSEEDKRFIQKMMQGETDRISAATFNKFSYTIKADRVKFETEEGETISLSGNIKNTGDCSWSNVGLKEGHFFKLGARIVRYGDEDVVLKECHVSLIKDNLSPNESSDFEIKIETKGLIKGIYLLKIDMVKQKSFWFEDKGVEPLRFRLTILKASLKSEIIEVSLPKEAKKNNSIGPLIKIKNIGQAAWDPHDKANNIRIGCRLYDKNDKLRHVAMREFRSELINKINPGEVLEVKMNLDLSGLKPDKYMLVFDMINEHKFWFSERGSKVFVLQVVVGI